MQTVEHFKPEHLSTLDPQRVREAARSFLTPAYAKVLAENGGGYTIRVDGKIAFLGGICLDMECIGWLWQFFTEDHRDHAREFRRETLGYINHHGAPLFAVLDHQDAEGTRWIEKLGFSFQSSIDVPGAPDAHYFLFKRP